MTPQENKQNMPHEEWFQSVRAAAGTGEPAAFSSLLDRYYERGRSGKELIISLFRDKPDSFLYPVLEQSLRNHDNTNLRNAAMEVYAALAGRSVPPLALLLRDRDEEVRTFAGVMLGNIKDRSAVPPLIEALGDPDLNVKHAVAEALGKIKDPRAVDAMLHALDADMWLQFPAAMALGELGDRRAVGPLIALLEVPGANVPAIQALGKIGDPAALGPLSRFLEDEEPSLRDWALEAVAKLVPNCPRENVPGSISKKATGMLLETLHTDSLKARRNAVAVLGYARSREAVPALTRLFAEPELREDALDAVARIGGDAVVHELVGLTRDADPLVRRAAIGALAGVAPEQGVKAVVPLLKDPADDVRKEAALALARINTDEARNALAGMLAEVTGAAYEAEKKTLEAYAALTAERATFQPDPADIIPLRDYLSERLGLFYDDDRLHVLYHRLLPLAAAGGFHSLRGYYRHLTDTMGASDIEQMLAPRLTNNETYFFREWEQLSAFARTLLPEVLDKRLRAPGRKLRVLSAGCSTGEEAYTLAILLDEAGVPARGAQVEIVGMDIDARALAVGREGRYSSRSFRGGDRGALTTYFKQEDGLFVPQDRIRGMVRFERGNLLDAEDAGKFDVIFCRNVLIYFSDESMERVARSFHEILTPGGYLLLGHSESFCRISTDLVPVRIDGTVAYQKK